MKMIKRLWAMIACCAMLLTIMPLESNAASGEVFEISCSSVSVSAGAEVTLDIILKNNPGFSVLNVALVYDQTYLSQMSIKNKVSSLYMSAGTSIVWDSAENYTADGLLATATFAVADHTPAGDYEVNIVFWGASNDQFQEVTATVSAGKITVKCPHVNTTNIPETPAGCVDVGFTAGVWCDDCKTYISGHETIPATGKHTDADGLWERDEVCHFRTCDCGAVFDSGAHSGGSATCKEKAKCSVCTAEYGQLNAGSHAGGTTVVNAAQPDHQSQTAGYTGDTQCLGCGEIIAYGETIAPEAHDFTQEDQKPDALKSLGNCRDCAVYYYSCSICGLVESDSDHTFYGEKDPTVHTGGTVQINASEANHGTQIDGYTGDTQCLGCGEILTYGEEIPAGAHIPGDSWAGDETHHWRVCSVDGCGLVLEDTKEEHHSTGDNLATNEKQAICDICGVSYGELLPSGSCIGGEVTSYGGSDPVTVELWAGAECLCTITTLDGIYVLTDIVPGSYTLKFSKKNHATRSYEVTTDGTDIAQDAKICLMGDVNGDGKVNIGDTARAYAHVKQATMLTDPYSIQCSDVSGDTRLNIGDVARIYAHVKNTSKLW